jgi:tetratricopeptide (TPR) repeat protein
MNRFCGDEQSMAAYLDSRLAQEELREYETHLAECSRCRSELDVVRAELEEMGLGPAVREALAERAGAAAPGGRSGVLGRFIMPASEFFGIRPGALKAAGAVAVVAAAILVAAVSILPRVVPSWNPDLRRGESDVRAILASEDIGDLRLVDGAPRPHERAGALRGAAQPDARVFGRAEAALQKALVRHPESSAAYNMLGDLYVAEGEADRAATAYRNALLIRPDDPAILNNLAVAVYRAGDLALARGYLERASAAVDAPAEIWYNLAMVWRASGNREEMKRCLGLYLEKDRSSPWAAQARRILNE